MAPDRQCLFGAATAVGRIIEPDHIIETADPSRLSCLSDLRARPVKQRTAQRFAHGASSIPRALKLFAFILRSGIESIGPRYLQGTQRHAPRDAP
jgi:hypothetical protein